MEKFFDWATPAQATVLAIAVGIAVYVVCSGIAAIVEAFRQEYYDEPEGEEDEDA